MKKTNVQNMVMTGLCVAIGLTMPQLFHSIPQGGAIFLPMHLPVLLCGLLCGWAWGLGCGLLTPFLSNLIFSMPPAPSLPSMLIELAIYGLAAGLLYRTLKLNIYVSLLCTMLTGRIVHGLIRTGMFLVGGSEYSFGIFFTSMFVRGLPGIVMQIVLLPILVLALEKAGVTQKPRAQKTA